MARNVHGDGAWPCVAYRPQRPVSRREQSCLVGTFRSGFSLRTVRYEGREESGRDGTFGSRGMCRACVPFPFRLSRGPHATHMVPTRQHRLSGRASVGPATTASGRGHGGRRRRRGRRHFSTFLLIRAEIISLAPTCYRRVYSARVTKCPDIAAMRLRSRRYS